MKRLIFNTLIIAIFFVFIAIGCKKSTVNPSPTLSFVVDTGYVSSDTVMACGDTTIIGLNCAWNGSDALSTINTYYNSNKIGESYQVNQAMGQGLTYETKITKNLLTHEKWEFELIDSKGQASRIGLTLTIDSGGPINTINAMIGAQNYVSLGSYYDFTNQLNYYETQASVDQDLIDLVGGYDFIENSFLASPGSQDFFGAYDFSLWETKNLTQFCTTSISSTQFNLVNKDNLLVSAFHADQADDIIKKLEINNVYSFKTQNGKYGLLIIINTALSESGYIIFDYKIQQ